MESDVQIVEDEENDVKNDSLVSGSSEIMVEERTEDDGSEEEDVDFNPFLKETLSEASSSLSSEVEGLDNDAVNSHVANAVPLDSSLGSPKRLTNVTNEGGCGGEDKRDVLVTSELENDKVSDKEIGLITGTNAIEDVVEAEMRLINLRNKPIIDLDDDDAICKRTRARYSLASITLDELETFLQESDDDDDIQNVDEEEEYKKFLTAVLNGGNGDDQGNLEGNDDDDDDEDNDADFEIEIEEALESDNDDCTVMPNKDEKYERASRRPETRQKDRKKANPQTKKRITQGNQILRPLLPIMPTASSASVPCLGRRNLALETSSQFPSFTQASFGFQEHQIGQLHCLIYEHVQLLVQVYSLCVLDTSRQHIASQIKGFLLELLHKRDLILTWRNRPYPTSCFLPSYTCPSVSHENKTNIHVDDSGLSSYECQGSRWLPAVGGSVLSVLDVAPLKLVGKYIDDVSNAVRDHQRRCVETTNFYLEKQPLFPLPISSVAEVDCNAYASNRDDPSLKITTNNKVSKKTLAATIVESTKKQSVALVPPQIANLVVPFYSLFNPALFPHRPPSPAIANRVLFMDSEDMLLAMGIMEYNNDWKAIKERFLPCKSEHQLFVRAKNRRSSKAPENPIKTVQKMKTSPLTEEEKVRIQEGLKVFKFDWASVWRNVVPYRDPNLLARQWRTAIGTQKSYRADSAKKERHRIYESIRRKGKAAADYSQAGSEENESGEDCMDNDNEAYVHEAFLADWRPASSRLTPSKIPPSSLDLPFARSCDVPNGEDFHEIRESEADRGHVHAIPAASEDAHTIHNKSLHLHATSSYPPPISTPKSFGELLFCSQKSGKPSVSNLVKLAPELPPVKLPSAVRIISQASLRSSQVGSSGEVGSAGPGLEKTYQDSTFPDCSANLVRPMQDKYKMSSSEFTSVPSQMDGLIKNRGLTKEKGTDMDPQMHPLLFRTMEEGHLPHYPVNNSLSIPTFSFFPPAQHQMNVALLRNSCTVGPDTGLKSFTLKESDPTSSSLDFHPLLQRAKEVSTNSLDAGLTGSLLNTDLELSRDQFMEDTVYDAGATAAQMANATRPTSPNVDANDLDLDIHLSSAAKRRKETSHERLEINTTVPLANETRVVESVIERNGMSCNLSQLPEPQLTDLVFRRHKEISGQVKSATVLHKLDGSNDSCINDNVGSHTLSDIVMEQEELSDSDEELEDVEFEREEMEDSDGEEGSDFEQVVNTHKKDQLHSALGANSQSQPSKLFGSGASERNQAQRKEKTPRSGLAGRRKGRAKGPWLSLNSHGSHYDPLPKIKKKENSSLGGLVLSPPKRSYKKAITSSKAVSFSERNNDICQQDSFPTQPRKSRKYSLKSSSSLVRADNVPAGDSNCTEKDKKA